MIENEMQRDIFLRKELRKLTALNILSAGKAHSKLTV